MAIATYKGICASCGKEFESRKKCYNRKEADEYEAWAAQNITLCGACFAKERTAQAAAEATAILEEYGVTLPQITGASDKQIAYAESKRASAIGNDLHELRRYCKLMQHIQQTLVDKHDEMAAQIPDGMTLEDCILETIDAYGLRDMHTVMTTTEARKLLDTLH